MPAPPGLGWLGWWGDSKPPSSSMSGISPAKPSVANLPPPPSSTGGYAQNGGYGQTGQQSTSLASYPSGTGVSQPAANQAPGGYNVGPYAMSNTSHNHSHSHAAPQTPGTYSGAGTYSSAAGAAPSNYAGGLSSQTPGLSAQGLSAQSSQTPTYGGYQSPYAASAANTSTANSSAPRTADGRSVYGAGESVPKLNPYTAQSNSAASGGSWNDDRSQGSSLGASTNSAAGADVNAQLPRTYSNTPSPAAYNSGGGSWAPPESAGAQGQPTQNLSTDRYDASASNSSLAPRRDGAFRPGSTARNGGALPTQLGASPSIPTQSQGTNSAYGSNFPSSNSAYPSSNSAYPSTGYPTLGGAERTANGTDSVYPSQMR